MKVKEEKQTIEVDYDWWKNSKQLLKFSYMGPMLALIVSSLGWWYVIQSKIEYKEVEKPVVKYVTKTVTKTIYVDIKKLPDPLEVLQAKEALRYLRDSGNNGPYSNYYKLLLKYEISPMAKYRAEREI